MGEYGRSYFSTTVQILLEYYASLDLHSAKLLKAQSSLSLFAFKDTYFCQVKKVSSHLQRFWAKIVGRDDCTLRTCIMQIWNIFWILFRTIQGLTVLWPNIGYFSLSGYNSMCIHYLLHAYILHLLLHACTMKHWMKTFSKNEYISSKLLKSL